MPELADQLTPDQAHVAGQIQARVIAVRRGAWDGYADACALDGFGYLVLSGTLLRVTRAKHREGAELLGLGDVVQPHQEPEVLWRAVEETTLVPLDHRLMIDSARMPLIAGGLLSAASTRANTVARQLVISQWSSVDERIIAVLEMLSERWGVVTRDGVVLPDWLTHSIIAPLVGARRPSVTTALKRLDGTGAVTRRPDGRWLLGAR
jgi:CRP/FNR family transcriptional regulator, cyclic AMP receptor protein